MRDEETGRNSIEPKGELASRTLAMPADCNPGGAIFGGWIMAPMDSAGKMSATPYAAGRVMTVAVSNIAFLQPVHVGDTVCCYTEAKHIGRTSITLDVEVWVLRQGQGERVKVTEAEFTFVAVDEDGRPRELVPARGRGASVSRSRDPPRRPSIKGRHRQRAALIYLGKPRANGNNAMPVRILVINPNSTDAVTRAIDDAMAPLRIPGGPEIVCLTLEEGPPGVESQSDADGVILPLCRVIREADAATGAFVIACFSDPGLFSAREATAKPVLGIAECGILTALTLGHRFGVISILDRSVPRHLRYIDAMGVGQRLAGDLPIGLGVTELADARATLTRMVDVGRRLRDQHGADVLVMGCAGMARYRADLEEAVQIPVVEPTQAAVAMAIGRVRLGWGRSLPL